MTTPGPYAGLISDELGRLIARPDGYFDFHFERRLKKPVAKVWAAITVAERIAAWFTTVEIEPRVGGRYWIRFEGFPGAIEGEITAFEPEHRLVHTWPEPGHPAAIVTYELEPDGDGCLLRFSNTGVPRAFLGALPGWHTFFEALPGACEGERTDWTMERETEVGQRYQDVLAPHREGAAS